MPLSNVTLHDDLAAAISGDHEAFGRLIAARWSRLARLARSIVGDADAEDVAQAACVDCWRHLDRLADFQKFDNWLLRIVFRRAVRRARWQRLHLALAAEPEGARADPSSSVFVWQVLSALPPRQRAVVHLTAVEGMTDSEIAATLGIRAASVRAHRRRAKQTIQALCAGPARGPAGCQSVAQAVPERKR